MKIQKDLIETKNLILRKAVKEDYKLLYKNFWSDKVAWKYMLWRPIKNQTEAKAKIQEIIEKQDNSPRFIVVEKKQNQPIGLANIILREDESVKDFAVGLGKEFTGKGYGKEISKALINYSFEILEQDEIFTACMTNDKQTIALQRSLGLEEKGISPKYYIRNWDGLNYNKVKFTLKKEQWLKRRSKFAK